MSPRDRITMLCVAGVVVVSGCGSPTSPTPAASTQSTATVAAGPTTSPGPPTDAALKVERAVMLEVQSRSGWYYAPQLTLTETSGKGAVSITSVVINIPGHSLWACTSGLAVPAGQTVELFPTMYGDFSLTFDRTGWRSSGDALLTLHFVDQAGHSSSLAVTAPITPGELPLAPLGTYSPNAASWRCEAQR